jgi:hypothetical protein
MHNSTFYPMQGWIPYKITINNDGPLCHWIDTYNKPYIEPFFDETISKMRGIPRRHGNYCPVSSLAMLEEWATQLDYIEPDAFIFHISRCGSTLVSQLLGLDEQNISLSEVPIFDDILRLSYKLPQIDQAYTNRLFKAALKFYGQKRTGAEKHLFIKTDSWHIHFHGQLRELYPATPFVLLYRRPNQVFESHTKMRGIQAVPGLIEPEIFGFENHGDWDLDTHLANVLISYLKKYVEISLNDLNTLLVNYNEGIMPIMNKIAVFTKITLSNGIKQKMMDRTNYHSKYPGELFSEKRDMAGPSFLQEAFELYRQVEEKRSTIQAL